MPTIQKTIFVFSLMITFACCIDTAKNKSTEKPNVIFIIVDDLMPSLQQYGNDQVVTPHLNDIISQATLFKNAYCQQAVCVPSRASFLTGLRPETNGTNSFGAPHFREKVPDVITFPQFFKNHGYHTAGLGKIFHYRDPISWTKPVWVPTPDVSYPIYTDSNSIEYQIKARKEQKFSRKPANWWASGDYWLPAASWESTAAHDTMLFDGMITNNAIEIIRNKSKEPLFLSIGYFRPHIPFVAPKKYFDLYPLERIKLPEYPDPPKDAPKVSLHDWGETRLYNDIPDSGNISAQKTKALIRAYYACISYVDHQIGRVISELKRQKMYDSSLIIICSDHGYHLGDFNLWGKYTNFEQGTKVPLLIKLPHQQVPSTIYSPVELIDIYPTAIDALGFQPLGFLEGKSLFDQRTGSIIDRGQYAYSQYVRGDYTGYSIRSKNFRYTTWISSGNETFHEFYDYSDSPVEIINQYGEERYASDLSVLQENLSEVFNLDL